MKSYQTLLRMHPDQTEALYNLANLYDRQGDSRSARSNSPGSQE